MLYQMQKTRGLYLHTRSRVFKNREGSINLFHLSIQKLKVPSISIVQWEDMAKVASGEGLLFGMLYLGVLVWVPSLQKAPINQSVALSSLSTAFLTVISQPDSLGVPRCQGLPMIYSAELYLPK